MFDLFESENLHYMYVNGPPWLDAPGVATPEAGAGNIAYNIAIGIAGSAAWDGIKGAYGSWDQWGPSAYNSRVDMNGYIDAVNSDLARDPNYYFHNGD